MSNTQAEPIPSMNYINRELSWLQFNERVLEEAHNSNHPLLERLKFLAISGSNLDEFCSIRIAGIINQLSHSSSDDIATDNISITTNLADIQSHVAALYKKQYLCWQQLQDMLHKEHIQIIRKDDYSENDAVWLKDHFTQHIFPMLTPMLVDTSHPLPHLSHLALTIIVEVKTPKHHKKENSEPSYVVIPIPKNVPRFVEIMPGSHEKHHRFAVIEDIIQHTIDILLPGHDIIHTGLIRIIRDSELQLSDKANDLIKSFEKALMERMRGQIINLEISDTLDEKMMDFITSSLNISPQCTTTYCPFLGINSIMSLYKVARPKLKFPPYNSRFPERITDFHGDCFAAIQNKDIIIHHPYETFDVVVQFLEQAAKDPNVVSIKQTLYRTSNDSPIVEALIKAARAGKNVTAVVEVKARFDEAANLEWGKHLRKAGAHVIFGVGNTKVHSKISLVVRQSSDKTKSYVHLGTGNYHPTNAKIYSDLSFFTCDERITQDVGILFNYMTDPSQPIELPTLSCAPFTLKKDLLGLIKKEEEFAKSGKYGHIWLKANSLLDKEIIDALYSASSAGVKVELIIRGICCLKPGVPGLSDNITVKSIVGRFLEHARIFCFGNGGVLPSENAKIFISSADLMPRNMHRRIEIMLPVFNDTVRKQIMNKIMMANLVDRKQSWMMQPDGSYERVKYDNSDSFAKLSAHEYFMRNPSLSGRGSALHGGITGNPAFNMNSEKIAVVDIGSNSIRLVVYHKLSRTPIRLYNEKLLCGLAKDMEHTKRLNPEGAKLALQSIERFTKLTQSMKVNTLFCFATAAVRDAIDGREFIAALEKNCHLTIQILSGREEARFAAMGVAAGIHSASGIVGDLGGGSLELANISCLRNQSGVLYSPDIVAHEASFPLGALRLQSIAEQGGDVVQDLLNDTFKDYPLEELLRGKTFYAVGGGFRALAKIHQTMKKHPIRILHHYDVPATQLLRTLHKLQAMTPDKLDKLPSLASNRRDTILQTAQVLETIIRTGNPKQIIFSTSGVREGILFDKLPDRIKGSDALIDACTNMITSLSPGKGEQWIQFGQAFFEWSNALFDNETEHMQRLRLAASILNSLAWHEHNGYKAETAFRWVIDSELPAIDHWERAFIATIVFHRHQTDHDKKITGEVQKILSEKWIKRARQIGIALHLAYVLSGGTAQILKHTPISRQDDRIILRDEHSAQLISSPNVRKYAKKLAKSMDCSADIVEPPEKSK